MTMTSTTYLLVFITAAVASSCHSPFFVQSFVISNKDIGSTCNARSNTCLAYKKHQTVKKGAPSQSTVTLKQNRKANKRTFQVAAMKKKAEKEDRFFRHCQSQRRDNQLPKPTAEELFGQQSTQGIHFASNQAIPVEIRRDTKIPPCSDFSTISLHPTLHQNVVERMKYTSPTPIQQHSIPLALAGDDLMCSAQTGSGKTCAFLLPILARMLKNGEQPPEQELIASTGPAAPQCLILAPTRELAIQIAVECQKLLFSLPLSCVAVYGGANSRPQLQALATTGAHVVVATPGRLADFVDRKLVTLSRVQYLVLDEADRQMDMGFEPQIRRIVSTMTPKSHRQTLMFSATFETAIQKLAANFLRKSYTWIAVGRVGSTTDSITQTIVRAKADKRDKLALVVDAIENGPTGRTLVFVQKKRSATWLKTMLTKGGPSDGDRFRPIPAEDIHGDRSQSQRESALRKFRDGTCRLLVATDVAARGLDVAGIEHVVNMDLPTTKEEFDSYVHRIGRTGRAGHTGLATSLFVPGENGTIAPALVRLLREGKQDVPRWLETMVSRGARSPKKSGGTTATDVRRSANGRRKQRGRPGR